MSFFAPPPIITAEVHTRLPDRFRNARPTVWARENRGGMEIDSFLEGPAFGPDGRLYVTDIPFGRVFRIDAGGEWELVAEYDGQPNGLKFHADGRIFITDFIRGLVMLDPASGAITPLLDGPKGQRFLGVNDLTFTANGDLYFTDQGQTGLQDASGRLYRLSARGELTCLLDTIPSPNGIVVDEKANHILVAVTRAQQIWRIPIRPDGIVAKVGVFAQLHGGLGGPDGLALGDDGSLFVAHTGFGSVWHLSRFAEPLARIASPVGHSTTNLAFGGPSHQELFITESHTGTILRASASVPGRSLFGARPRG